ncbi:Voltage-gated hydrogen channel 1 [Vanrija pseudolonga]|uniref:Voltage-gated hydrogen channel 1 n=1 Tax=Vanrija pseudolonga TaxID=143232 RepID=A0AAF0Y0V8_9TREE|nr:Voltage-gated hydrogen channel 1 [Vanrija pseudolonga]
MPDETEPLLRAANVDGNDDDDDRSETQKKVGELLEAKSTHRFLLMLIAIDAIFVLIDLGYVILNPPCEGEAKPPPILEWLSQASLAIDLLFLLELPLEMYAFGPRFFGLSLQKRPAPHFVLHIFDALVIIGTVILEIVLSGQERELAGLLVVLRLWRIVKLVRKGAPEVISHINQVGGVATGVGEWDESAVTAVAKSRARIAELEAENKNLKTLLGMSLDDEVAEDGGRAQRAISPPRASDVD